MNLALIGSRNFHDYDSFHKAVLLTLQKWGKNLSDVEYIVSGGAKGADTLAEIFAKEYSIKPMIFPVKKEDWYKYGKAAGIMRNTQIIDNASHVIAFPSKYGKGTQDSINKANKRKLPIQILYID